MRGVPPEHQSRPALGQCRADLGRDHQEQDERPQIHQRSDGQVHPLAVEQDFRGEELVEVLGSNSPVRPVEHDETDDAESAEGRGLQASRVQNTDT